MASSTTPGGGSGRSTTSWRPAPPRRTATGSCSTTSGSTAAARCWPTRRPARRARPIGYEAWWGLPALPKLNTDQPRGPRVPPAGWRSTGCASGSTAGGSTCRRRSTTRRSGRSSDAAAGRSDPTPTSSARSGRSRRNGCAGDRFDALMNYPLGEAILGFAGGPALDMDVVRRHHEYARSLRPLDGPAFADRVTELAAAYDPDVVGGPARPGRVARRARGCGRSWATTSPASGWRRSSR